ncbi:hypothetical protein [Halomontanus rarus]|uniref:hypothetical protein n=1 Tax=Halomontanus rarus TaxID=3034020 RepID=UPI0023E8504C|nr:hypothetical protein [Halovivax sp. TS33]
MSQSTETRDTSVTVQVNDLEKRKFETLAEAYDSSQAGVGRHLVDRAYHELFGDLHPKALERHDIDINALVRGEISIDELPDDCKMGGDGPAKIPATDGGASANFKPSSYSATHSPAELAQSGPQLSWDKLKDAVDRHWSDELEIHPDRVFEGDDDRDGVLKQRPKYAARILAAILRSKGDVVTQGEIDLTILKYTDHQIDRAPDEYKAGKEYKKEKYGGLITRYFVPHPDPLEEKYYTSEAAMEELLPKEIEETISELVEEQQFVLDPFKHGKEVKINPREDPTQWLEDLASFRRKLGVLHAVREDSEFRDILREVDDKVFDEYPHLMVAVSKTFTDVVHEYATVNEFARYTVADTLLDVDEDRLLEYEDYDSGDEVRTVNPDRPAQPIQVFRIEPSEPMGREQQFRIIAGEI